MKSIPHRSGEPAWRADRVEWSERFRQETSWWLAALSSSRRWPSWSVQWWCGVGTFNAEIQRGGRTRFLVASDLCEAVVLARGLAAEVRE